MTSPKSTMLKDRDYDVTPHIIAHLYPQIHQGSAKECEVYCGDGCLLASWACVVDGWEVVTLKKIEI